MGASSARGIAALGRRSAGAPRQRGGKVEIRVRGAADRLSLESAGVARAAVHPAGVLNRTLRSVGPWALRAGLFVWLMNVEDPFRLAGAVLVLAAQIPIQRQVLAWGFARR